MDAKAVGFVPNDCTFDNTPILNSVIANATDDRVLSFPPGDYYFLTQPEIIDKHFIIEGIGLEAVKLIRKFNGMAGTALIHCTENCIIRQMSIKAAAGTSNGDAIRIDGLDASGSILRDLYITGEPGGTWRTTITLTSSDPLGIRSCLIDNVEAFAATVHIAHFLNVKGATIRINGYPAGGTVSHMTIQHFNQHRSAAIQFETRHLPMLYLYNTDDIKIQSLGGTVLQVNNSTNVKVI